MQQGTIQHKRSQIAYQHFGTGPECLICLHGFGEDAASFAFLEPHLAERFTVISIDMPFHGATIWKDGLLFTVEDLHGVIGSILPAVMQRKDEGIRFSLLGYSMGGRLALAYFQAYPDRVKHMALVATDGLHRNRWYRLATQTIIGNRIFKFTMQQPQWFMGLVRLTARTGLLNKSISKFVHHYLHDAAVRTALYQRWTTMRRFRPHLAGIKALARERGVSIRMLFGMHDRIILHQTGQRFREGHEGMIDVHIIEAGHQLLKEKYAADIIGLLHG